MPSKFDPLQTLDVLYRRGLGCLAREVRRLETLTLQGKLSGPLSRDLREYLHLIKTMKYTQDQLELAKKAKAKVAADKLSDAELAELANKSGGQ